MTVPAIWGACSVENCEGRIRSDNMSGFCPKHGHLRKAVQELWDPCPVDECPGRMRLNTRTGFCRKHYYRAGWPLTEQTLADRICVNCDNTLKRSNEKGLCWRCQVVDGSLTPDARLYSREWRQTERGRYAVRRNNLKKYGITPEQYDEMHEAQQGLCAACGREETGRNASGPVSLAVDHDHNNGAIRGLLCMACNRALGLIGDSLESARNLVKYLERHYDD